MTNTIMAIVVVGAGIIFLLLVIVGYLIKIFKELETSNEYWRAYWSYELDDSPDGGSDGTVEIKREFHVVDIKKVA